MSGFPDDIDLQAFWDDSVYARNTITDLVPSDALIAETEAQLGYRLPASYVAFMRRHNGGTPHACCFPTEEATSWAEDHVAITSFLSIGRNKRYSLAGELGSRFMIEQWGYPDIGVYICDCPSAGHDMVALDYRACGPDGEPQVVHVDQEGDYRITLLARNFETFVRGLVSEEVFDTAEEDFQEDRRRVTEGEFSEVLAPLLDDFPPFPRIGEAIRAIALQLLEEKGYFALHGDPLSYLLYDVQFWVYQHRHRVERRQDYLEAYPPLIAFGGRGFSTGGYAPGFVEDWFKARLDARELVESHHGIGLSEAHQARVIKQLQQVLGAAGQ
ncbi:SMI1/KNR4 family protein [Pseudomonas argentinensis]|uniref:SMI1-KNR4 cell-wall n=1 Tax=Phytopseudomonas argentinensis TaxID=289370 RepID=A0A1I3M1E3_9GAMM|nr:SMI1/KNR4 family protein [Pseudomonas argentinensis]KAB0547107.1 SMI1/KNR4 family protein [Pseudomonas argentinensis]SFI90793.1 SMI1-KNR4 cell-wall [Pseudomonas argentinensis]